MYPNINEDAKTIIQLLWDRDDVDMWSFEPYKGIAYILIQKRLKSNYNEMLRELIEYIKNPTDAWKIYCLNLIIDCMKEDQRISECNRILISRCKFTTDMPSAIHYIQRNHNVFMTARDLATNIYDEFMIIHKKIRAETIQSYIKSKEPDNASYLYDMVHSYKDIEQELYKFIKNGEIESKIYFPIEIVKIGEYKNLSYWHLFKLWITYKEDKDSVLKMLETLSRQRKKQKKTKLINMLTMAHRIAISNIFDEFKVFQILNEQTAYERGCDHNEYDPNDWQQEVQLTKDLNKFISNCDIDYCSGYRFVGIKENQEFEIQLNPK